MSSRVFRHARSRGGCGPDLSQRNSAAGFLLPLAATGALMLLLSSLSVQAAVLQSRRLQQQELQRQQQEDQLASAAHHLGADLQGPYACLRQSPSSRWQLDLLAAGCAAALDPQAWLQQLEQQHGVRVKAWEPGGPDGLGSRLRLQRSTGGPIRSWQWQTLGLREVGA